MRRVRVAHRPAVKVPALHNVSSQLGPIWETHAPQTSQLISSSSSTPTREVLRVSGRILRERPEPGSFQGTELLSDFPGVAPSGWPHCGTPLYKSSISATLLVSFRVVRTPFQIRMYPDAGYIIYIVRYQQLCTRY